MIRVRYEGIPSSETMLEAGIKRPESLALVSHDGGVRARRESTSLRRWAEGLECNWGRSRTGDEDLGDQCQLLRCCEGSWS